MSLDDIIPLSSTVCTRMQTKLSTRRWTLHDVVDTIVSDSCDIIVPRRSDESPASASARSRLNSARVMSRVVHYSRLYRVSTCAWRQFRSGSLDLWRNIFTHCRIFRWNCNDGLFVFFLLVYFLLPREQLCYRGLGRRNSVCLSVCPSICHTRALWQNQTMHCGYFDTTGKCSLLIRLESGPTRSTGRQC